MAAAVSAAEGKEGSSVEAAAIEVDRQADQPVGMPVAAAAAVALVVAAAAVAAAVEEAVAAAVEEAAVAKTILRGSANHRGRRKRCRTERRSIDCSLLVPPMV